MSLTFSPFFSMLQTIPYKFPNSWRSSSSEQRHEYNRKDKRRSKEEVRFSLKVPGRKSASTRSTGVKGRRRILSPSIERKWKTVCFERELLSLSSRKDILERALAIAIQKIMCIFFLSAWLDSTVFWRLPNNSTIFQKRWLSLDD